MYYVQKCRNETIDQRISNVRRKSFYSQITKFLSTSLIDEWLKKKKYDATKHYWKTITSEKRFKQKCNKSRGSIIKLNLKQKHSSTIIEVKVAIVRLIIITTTSNGVKENKSTPHKQKNKCCSLKCNNNN